MIQDWKKYLVGSMSSDSVEPIVETKKIDSKVGSDSSLLSAIYSLDPITNAPTGDIACYVSDKTSPDVKRFILENLMRDVSSDAMPAVSGLSDDEILTYQRGRDESRDAYALRLSEYARMNAKIVEDAKRNVSADTDKQSADK